jgi:type II secretory pathway component GspD/PulD (secretin)/predicted RNA-binding protein with PUA-like domain
MLAHLKLSILFIAAISWHLQDVRAQEDATPKAAPKEAAPKDPTPKDPTPKDPTPKDPAPKDPAPKAAPPKAAAPAKAAPKVTALKNVDYTVLAEPAIANRLALTDEQRAAVAANLDERLRKLVAAPAAERRQILADSNKKLDALLTNEQKATLAGVLTGGKLRFNFRQQKWPDVLDWFARQADLALVMDAPPPGLFTYSDTKEHTPAEAIDLLNSVLLSKGFTLMRREKMLLVVDTSEGIPFEMAPKVTVQQLASRGRFEIVTVEFSLGGRPIDSCLAAAQGLVGNHGRATPLTGAGKIIVTETAGKLQAINQVITAIPVPVVKKPVPPPPKPVFAVYPAKGLDPQATVEMLQSLFPSATIKADPTAEEIQANATPEIQAGILASVEKMTANVSGDKRARLQVYYVASKDLTELQSQLTLAVPKAQITVDEAQHRLLVVANMEQQAEVKETLESLGAADKESEATVTVYPVEDEMTDSLATLLQQVLPRALVVSQPGRIAVRGHPGEQKLAQTTIEQFAEAKPKLEKPSLTLYPLTQPLDASLLETMQAAVPDATLTLLGDGKRLSVVGVAEDQALVAATLKRIDAEIPKPEKPTLTLYPLAQPLDATVLETLQAAVPDANLTLLGNGTRLSVVGVAEDQALVAATLKRIDAEIPKPEKPTLTLYPLTQALDATLLETMQAAVPDATLTLLGDGKRLSVVGVAEDQALVAATLKRIDTEVPKPEKPTLKLHPLSQPLDATLLATIQSAAPDAVLTLLGDGKRLSVVGVAADQTLVEAMLKQIDAELPKPEKRMLATYKSERLPLSELQPLLVSVVPDVEIRSDAAGERLIVWASEEEHKAIAATLESIGKEPIPKGPSLETYAVPDSEAKAILATVQALAPDVQASLDATNRRLIVVGDAEAQRLIDGLLKKLAPTEQMSTQVLIAYPLKQADPEAVVTMLQELKPGVRFAADARANRVLVTAPLREQLRLRAIIEQLDAAPDASQEDVVKSYPLKTLNPAIVVELLQPHVPEMKLSVDPAAKQVLASGKEFDHEKLKKAVAQIDGEAAGGNVQSYDIGKADPDRVQNVLMQLVPQAVVSSNPSAKRLMVWATEADHKAIQQAIDQFTRLAPSQERRLRTFPLPKTIGAAALTILQAAVPDAELSLDESGRQVIAWATEAEQKVVQEAIEELGRNRPKRDDISLQVHRAAAEVLRNANPLLADVAPEATLVGGGDADMWLVWATALEQKAIAELLATLTEQIASNNPERSIKAYPITHSDAALARQMIAAKAEKATILDNSNARRLVILGTVKEHEAIQGVLAEIAAVLKDPNTIVRVYPVEHQAYSAQTIVDYLDPASTEGISIRANADTNSLIVRATEAEHKRLKQAIEALVKELPAKRPLDVQVFRFKHGSPSAATTVLSRLVPTALMAADDTAGTLAVTASKAELAQIEAVIKQMQAMPPNAHRLTEIYRFKRASAESAQSTFMQLTPESRVAVDTVANAVIVTATKEEHQILRDAADKLEGQSIGSLVRVYPLNKDQIKASEVLESLDEQLKKTVAIQVNETVNSLIVRGNVESQKQMQSAIDAIVEQLPGAVLKTTKVYPLKLASAETIQQAIAPLVENGTVVGDEASGTLVVTGTEAEHKQIAAVIEKLDATPGQQLIMRAYPIKQADPQTVYETVTTAFGRSHDFAVTFQLEARTLFVVATPQNHETFKDLMTQLDRVGARQGPKFAKVYPLANVGGDVAAAALDALFVNQGVEVRFNPAGNALIVVASAEQHKAVDESLRQMQGVERQLEVFTLQHADPLVVENAIYQLFSEAGEGAAPSVSSDYNSQRLFVRGTKSQIEQIQQLLVRLGETGAASRPGTGDVRIIPFSGNTSDAVKQIEKIWPKLRSNRIQVIAPSDRGLKPLSPGKSSNGESGQKDEESSLPDADDGAETPAGANKQQAGYFVAMQETTRKATPRDKPPKNQEAKLNKKTDSPEKPTVVVVPGYGRITIASSDHEALDQLEALLRTIGQGSLQAGAGPNFAIFMLRNTGSDEMKELLLELFDELPMSTAGDVVIVADQRLNALIVHGRRKDREIVEELLRVLDTNELPESFSVLRPEFIQLENAQANRVRSILENVYKTQLTSGGGRKPLKVPEGVSPRVASVMMQFNAAAAGPLLTLDVDETTNSIVVRAPDELLREIKAFVQQLDSQATDPINRGVRVIRLQNSKSDRMQEVLQQFILKSQGSPARQLRR